MATLPSHWSAVWSAGSPAPLLSMLISSLEQAEARMPVLQVSDGRPDVNVTDTGLLMTSVSTPPLFGLGTFALML
jgi:hypothetical protein